MSKKASTTENRIILATAQTIPSNNATYTNYSYGADSSMTSNTITSGENDNYLWATIWNKSGNLSFEEIINSLQIEEGNKATTYEPYKAKEIYANGEKYTDTLSVGTEHNNSGLYVKESKNLFDGQTEIGSYSTTDGSKTTSTLVRRNTNMIKVNPNTTYTLSRNGEKVTTRFFYYNKNKAYISGEVQTGTFTTPNNCEYLCFHSDALLNNYSNIQVEIGSNVTSFISGEPEVYAYINEEYKKISNKNVYSTSEVVIGKWFGKPLYRKMVDYGVLPSNSTKNVAHGITNYQHIHLNLGDSYWTHKDNNLFNTNISNSFVYTGFISEFGVNGANISIKTNNANASNFNALICVEYTKTTD